MIVHSPERLQIVFERKTAIEVTVFIRDQKIQVGERQSISLNFWKILSRGLCVIRDQKHNSQDLHTADYTSSTGHLSESCISSPVLKMAATFALLWSFYSLKPFTNFQRQCCQLFKHLGMLFSRHRCFQNFTEKKTE